MSETKIYKIDRVAPLQILVAQAIPKLKWIHNGLGLLQGYISEPELRVHVWHPRLVTKQDQYAMIHDHRFDLLSSVILGAVYHTERLLTPNENGSWQLKTIDGSFNNLPTTLYDMQETTFEISAGHYYTYPKGLFHSVHTTDLAVTLCEKHNFEPQKQVVGALNIKSPPNKEFTKTAPWEDILLEASKQLMIKCT